VRETVRFRRLTRPMSTSYFGQVVRVFGSAGGTFVDAFGVGRPAPFTSPSRWWVQRKHALARDWIWGFSRCRSRAVVSQIVLAVSKQENPTGLFGLGGAVRDLVSQEYLVGDQGRFTTAVAAKRPRRGRVTGRAMRPRGAS